MTSPVKERGPNGIAAIAIGAFVLAGLVAHRAGVPPEPRPVDADPAVFSGERARASLARMLGDEEPHPVGSAAHAGFLERLVAELRAIGIEPVVDDALVMGANSVVTRVRNVVATIPGTRAGKAIALAAHHDSVPAGPGASDDGAGVAAAIECVRALRAGRPLDRTLVLLVTDGEEMGLCGAQAFVRTDPLAREIGAVVNLEARGTDGLAYLFQTGPGVGDALSRFGSEMPRPSTSSIAALVYDKLPNDTDLTVFMRAGWTGLNFAYIGGLRRYHTPRDDLAHLDTRSLQHLGDGALAGLRALDALDLETAHESRADRVWNDVLGRCVIGWPRGWSAPLAVIALVSLLAAVRRRVRANGKSARAEMLWSALAGSIGVIVGALSMWGFASAQTLVHDANDPWFAALDPWIAACLLVALLGAAIGCTLPRVRRARPENVWFGVWIPFATVGLAVAMLEPAASLIFVVPALVASVAAWFVVANVSTLRLVSSVLVPFAACAVFWLPFLEGVEFALGFTVAFVPGLLASCVAATLAPLLIDRPYRSVTGLALLVVLAFVVLAQLPDRTIDAPIWTNTAHVQTDESAQWSIVTYGTDLPASMHGVTRNSRRPLAWTGFLPSGHAEPAPRHTEPPPRVEVTEIERTEAGRRVRAKVTSPRGAAVIVLQIAEQPVQVDVIRSGSLALVTDQLNASTLTFLGIGPEGVEVEYVESAQVPAQVPARLHVADFTSGLPNAFAGPFVLEPTRVPRGRGDMSVVETTYAP